jgi:hypothetical protein
MRIQAIKRLLVGAPIPLAQARHERLGKAVALAVFASDPLSSVAYATEEILLVLILAGTVALSYSLPIALGIAALLAVVVISQTATMLILLLAANTSYADFPVSPRSSRATATWPASSGPRATGSSSPTES